MRQKNSLNLKKKKRAERRKPGKTRTASAKQKFRRIWKPWTQSLYYTPVNIVLFSFLALSLLVYFFESAVNREQFASIFDSLWWIMVTASTTGYGDKVPITISGRVATAVVIVLGVGVSSVISATFTSYLVTRNSRMRKGLMHFAKIKNHLIICGWKNQMEEVLKDMLAVSSEFTDENIIIISNMKAETFSAITEVPELHQIKFVRGDYFSENTLKRANILHAKKVIILADTTEGKNASEADSQTVLTVIKIKSISKSIYTCAEILDPKYEEHLRQAFCNEIIMIRDVPRQLLFASSTENGMSHIMQELLSLSHKNPNVKMFLEEVPEEMISKTYREFKDSLPEEYSYLLLGILENSGPLQKIRNSMLLEAQKTNNITETLQILQSFSNINLNRPVLMPTPDYIINPFSKAIFLKRKQSLS